MKIRMGFVANSSTCSFLIIGWQIDEEKHEELKKRIVLEKFPDLNLESDIFDEWEIIDKKWKEIRWNDDLPLRLRKEYGNDFAVVDYEYDESYSLINEFEKLAEKVKLAKEKYGFEEDASIFGGITEC